MRVLDPKLVDVQQPGNDVGRGRGPVVFAFLVVQEEQGFVESGIVGTAERRAVVVDQLATSVGPENTTTTTTIMKAKIFSCTSGLNSSTKLSFIKIRPLFHSNLSLCITLD